METHGNHDADAAAGAAPLVGNDDAVRQGSEGPAAGVVVAGRSVDDANADGTLMMNGGNGEEEGRTLQASNEHDNAAQPGPPSEPEAARQVQPPPATQGHAPPGAQAPELETEGQAALQQQQEEQCKEILKISKIMWIQ